MRHVWYMKLYLHFYCIFMWQFFKKITILNKKNFKTSNSKKIKGSFKTQKLRFFYAKITTFRGFFSNIFGNSVETWDLSLSPLSRLYCRDNIVITPIVIVATMLQQSQVYAYLYPMDKLSRIVVAQCSKIRKKCNLGKTHCLPQRPCFLTFFEQTAEIVEWRKHFKKCLF